MTSKTIDRVHNILLCAREDREHDLLKAKEDGAPDWRIRDIKNQLATRCGYTAERIAKRAGCSESTANSALRKIVAAGGAYRHKAAFGHMRQHPAVFFSMSEFERYEITKKAEFEAELIAESGSIAAIRAESRELLRRIREELTKIETVIDEAPTATLVNRKLCTLKEIAGYRCLSMKD